MNFCPNCGAKIPNPDDAFCFNCGQKLAAAPAPEETKEPAEAAEEMPEAGAAELDAPVAGSVPEDVAAMQQPAAAATAQKSDEEKKLAAQRIAQAINQDEFAQPAAGDVAAGMSGVAAGFGDLEKLVDTDGAALQPEEGFFAPEVTGAMSPGMRAPEVPDTQPPATSLQGLADLMEPEPQAMAPQGSLFEAYPDETATDFAQLEHMIARQETQELYAQPSDVAAPTQQQAQPAQQQQYRQAAQQRPAPAAAPQRAQKEAAWQEAPPQEAPAQREKPQRQAPPWVAQSQPQQTTQQRQPMQQRIPEPLPEPAPQKSAPPREAKPAKSGGGAVKVLLLAVLVVVAICATTLLMLYVANRPGKTIDELTQALQTQDVTALSEMVTLSDIQPEPDNEDWLALCDVFTTDAQVEQLKAELNQQVSDPEATGLYYGAIRMEAEPLFLFINRYHIRVVGVQVLAPGAAEGTAMHLGNNQYTAGQPTEGGVLFSHIMPGKYNGALVDAAGTQSSVFVIEALAYPEVNVIGNTAAGAQTATITVGNCRSDDAVLYVGGIPVPETPVNGVVTIPNVALGSEIRISLVENGQQMEATVTFTDPAVTNLVFGEYTAVGEAAPSGAASAPTLSASEIEDLMGVFYSSYLDCINAQSMGPLALSTADNTTRLEKRVVSDANKKNMFSYISVDCDEQSIVTSEVDGKPTIEFNMTFTYEYWPRDGSSEKEQAFNHQSVQLVYEDGQWLVNYMVFVDDEDFAAHKLAEFK